MQIIPAKTPGFVKTLFPNLVWNINTTAKELFLTFDDGPTPQVTEWVLDILKTYNAKATFFCIGSNVEKYPNIFNRIVEEGHVVGNHTYQHLNAWQHNAEDYMADVDLASKHIHSKLFRPPYGKLKITHGKHLLSLNYKIIMWDVLSFDWDAMVAPKKCSQNVIEKAKPGSIVVFHDSLKAENNLKYALLKVLNHFSECGFQFKAIHN
jgi:peptidoglycan/xylan/chitin deacetylase (PgdA/CDA1 family)